MTGKQGITAEPIPESVTTIQLVADQRARCVNCASHLLRRGEGEWVHRATRKVECGVGAKIQQLRKDMGR